MRAEEEQAVTAPQHGESRGEQEPDIEVTVVHPEPEVSTPRGGKRFGNNVEEREGDKQQKGQLSKLYQPGRLITEGRLNRDQRESPRQAGKHEGDF